MKIYKILFGKSPCDKCLIKPMCSEGCVSLNYWVGRQIRNVKLYSKLIKIGVFISLITLAGIKMAEGYISMSMNPVIMAILLAAIFISHPTVDFFKFKMLSYFNFKGRLDEYNREVYNDEKIKL